MFQSRYILAIPGYNESKSPYFVHDQAFMRREIPLQLNESFTFSNILTDTIDQTVAQLATDLLYGVFNGQNQVLLLNSAVQDSRVQLQTTNFFIEQLFVLGHQISEELQQQNLRFLLSGTRFEASQTTDLFALPETKVSQQFVMVDRFEVLQSIMKSMLNLQKAGNAHYRFTVSFNYRNGETALINQVEIFVNLLPTLPGPNDQSLKQQNQQLKQVIRNFESKLKVQTASNCNFIKCFSSTLDQAQMTSLCFLQDDLHYRLEKQQEAVFLNQQNSILGNEHFSLNLKQHKLAKLKEEQISVNDYQLVLVQQFALQANLSSSLSINDVKLDDDIRLEHIQKQADIYSQQYHAMIRRYEMLLVQRKRDLKSQQLDFIQQIILECDVKDKEQQLEKANEALELEVLLQTKKIETDQMMTLQINSPEIDKIFAKPACQLTQEQALIVRDKLDKQRISASNLKLTTKETDLKCQALQITQLQQSKQLRELQKSQPIASETRGQNMFDELLLSVNQQQLQIPVKNQSNAVRIKQQSLAHSLKSGNILKSTQSQNDQRSEKLTILKMKDQDLNIAVDQQTLIQMQSTKNIKELFNLEIDWIPADIPDFPTYYKHVNNFLGIILGKFILVILFRDWPVVRQRIRAAVIELDTELEQKDKI